MGNIGTERPEVEILPVTEPATVPDPHPGARRAGA